MQIKKLKLNEYEEEIKKDILKGLKNLKNRCVYELIKSDEKYVEICDDEIIPHKPVISIFQHIEIDVDKTKELYEFIERNKGIDWFMDVIDFLKSNKFRSGNTYNSEHNLTHDFQYYIYTYEKVDDIYYYYYNEEVYIIILFHYAGDIRSNYCKPIVCTPQPYSTIADMITEMTDVILYDSNNEQYIMQLTTLYKDNEEIEHEELIKKGITDIF